MPIMMRGYEPKHQHPRDREPIVQGGIMWETNELLHFVNPITGNSCDIKNAPFEFERLMLATPFCIGTQRVYEEDIIQLPNGATGVVSNNEDDGWIISLNENQKSVLSQDFFLLVSYINEPSTEIIGNTFEQADDFEAFDYTYSDNAQSEQDEFEEFQSRRYK